jgi:CHAT domain-containing protein
MHVSELAACLVTANTAEREPLLRQNSALADVQLARALKDICLDGWSVHPGQALGAAVSLRLLSHFRNDAEIAALERWAGGLEALVNGQMESAIAALNEAHSNFLALNLKHDAAATQVSKLVALAMLGSYDEAVSCGLAAREVFLTHGDLRSAGKIEHNIGNIYFRRDEYEAAEKFHRLAHQRFLEIDDAAQLTKIENSLALTLSQQHKLQDAERLYEQALLRAAAGQQLSTQAAIESSIGTLALYQSRYDRALDYLERSRRNYERVGMSHLSAMTEQEIADAYLELNLIPEAAEIYERVTKTFTGLGLRAEAARAHAYHARAAIILGQSDKAFRLLSEGAELYEHERNKTGAALIKLTEAQLLYAQGDCPRAKEAALMAESAFVRSGAPRRFMFAQWLRGESARCEGSLAEASEILSAALNQFGADQPDLAARCLTSLGRLAATAGDLGKARQSFTRAVELIEDLRAPLPAEEFRTSFFADKLTPYQELARLALAEGLTTEGFEFVERARSRALADTIGAATLSPEVGKDDFEIRLLRNIEQLREELNYFYRRLNLPREADSVRHDRAALENEIRTREEKILDVTRQLQHRGKYVAGNQKPLSLPDLQRRLGNDTVLVEYAILDQELLAFVIRNDAVEVIRNLAREADLRSAVVQFRFQIDSLRFGSAAMRRHLPTLTGRAVKHLEQLHRMLISPLESKIAVRRLVIVPHSMLHYLPFQALHDGSQFLIERHEISYAPSAAVLERCLKREPGNFDKALLMGSADATIPRVGEEIESLQELFPKSLVLLNEQATTSQLRRHAAEVDALHLACHAHFRADNPFFSSLQLADGWFTVRDAAGLRLHCDLVTLSACETGLNAIAPGDELIGLARGFFSAGTPAIVLSLWTVDDEATGQLMREFYRQLRRLRSATAALRAAQMHLLKSKPHPFFWSAFILMGRW